MIAPVKAPCPKCITAKYSEISIPTSGTKREIKRNQFLPCAINSCVMTFVRLYTTAVNTQTFSTACNPLKLSPYHDVIHPDNAMITKNGINVETKLMAKSR